MAHRTESPLGKSAPTLHTDGQVSQLVEVDHARRASRLLAFAFGPIGFFGVLDFVAALLRGTVGPSRFVSLALAVGFGVIALLAWRESRQPVINGKVGRPGERTDEMPPASRGGA